ncbi:MAG: glycosyltransferase [Pseudolysinimonas sp.]
MSPAPPAVEDEWRSGIHWHIDPLRPDVFIATDVRLAGADGGTVVARHSAAAYGRWEPYATAFGEVTIVGRTAQWHAGAADIPVTGSGVDARLVRGYSGFVGLVSALPALWKQFSRLGDSSSIFIGRPPEPLSLLLFLRARAVKARHIAVVATEPEQFMRGVVPGPVGRLAGRALGGAVRHVVRNSVAVVYVTQEWLQSRYPATAGTPTIGRPNVVLSDADFARRPRRVPRSESGFALVSIGNVNSRAKGAEDLVKVVEELRRAGHDATLRVAGGGSRLSLLRRHASRQGLAEHVHFEGHVSSRAQIRDLLDHADVYLTMSRAEGLSRSTVEAMARGLPVVSTRAGGISELVRAQQLVPIGDPSAAARAIVAIVRDRHAYAEASTASLTAARAAASSAEPQRLSEFLSALT